MSLLQVPLVVLAVMGSAFGDDAIFSPKWAMDIEDYAKSHSAPYSDDPNIRRSQIRWDRMDAIFLDDISGGYVGGGGALSGWNEAEIDFGLFKMPTTWTTVRIGGIAMGGDKVMGGGEFGVRLHTPTRLAPYIGLNSMVAVNGMKRHISYHRYYYENAQLRDNPRWGYFPTGMAAIAPEVGVSYWLTPSRRLNVGTGYYFATRGQPDFWMVNVSLDFVAAGALAQTPPLLPEGEMAPPFVPEKYYFDVPREPVLSPSPAGDPLELDVPASPLPAPLLLPDNGPYSISVPALLPDLFAHASKQSSNPLTEVRQLTEAASSGIASGSIEPVANPEDELRDVCKTIRERTPTMVLGNQPACRNPSVQSAFFK